MAFKGSDRQLEAIRAWTCFAPAGWFRGALKPFSLVRVIGEICRASESACAGSGGRAGCFWHAPRPFAFPMDHPPATDGGRRISGPLSSFFFFTFFFFRIVRLQKPRRSCVQPGIRPLRGRHSAVHRHLAARDGAACRPGRTVSCSFTAS